MSILVSLVGSKTSSLSLVISMLGSGTGSGARSGSVKMEMGMGEGASFVGNSHCGMTFKSLQGKCIPCSPLSFGEPPVPSE